MKAIMWLLVVTGCASGPRTVSGRIGHERSMAEVKLPVRETAREVTRLFTLRGFALAEQRAAGDGMALRFKDQPRAEASAYGSEFSVQVMAADRHALVSIDGTPTVNDRPVCQLGAKLPCATTPYDPNLEGDREAAVAQGVMAELALEDLAVPLDRSHPAVQAAIAQDRARCEAQVRQAKEDAAQFKDASRRQRLLAAIEPCP